MASEPEDRSAAPELPESLADWLGERAETVGVSEGELLTELVAAYRVAVEDDGVNADALADAIDINRRVDERQAALRSEMDDRLTALAERQQSALEDVRKRVVQLKQATKTKADADHGHEELDRVSEVTGAIEELESAIAELESAVAEHDDDLVTINEELGDLRDKLTQVARAVVDLRSRDELGESTVDPLLNLKRHAARADIDHATCAACDMEVDLALLGEAACPHCGAPFESLHEASGLLEQPQLTGPEADLEES